MTEPFVISSQGRADRDRAEAGRRPRDPARSLFCR
jgi:hypothetical protein